MRCVSVEKLLEKLMVQEELTRGTAAHWGIDKAIQIAESLPVVEIYEDDMK